MNTVHEDDRGCVLSILNPAFHYTPSHSTDVARTFAEHSTLDLADEYQSEQIETAACEQHESTWRTA